MKATHNGECQICGAKQALPGGRLSKHGYTVKWGFFSGVCHGAGELPFEQSKDAIAAVIANVETQIAETDAEIAALECLDGLANDGATAWHHTYKAYGTNVWERVPVINFTAHPLDAGRCYFSADVLLDDTRKAGVRQARKIEAYDKAFEFTTLRHWVHFLNCKYAKHLRQQNSSRRDWIRWQNGRCANWAPKELTPRA